MSGPVVALVPARGGSKRLPRKNLRPVGGVPIVVRAIRSGRDAARVDATYVSTDDEEIAALGAAEGVAVVRRPAVLASDAAQNDAVARHLLDALAAEGEMPEVLVLLQPTSPLRASRHVDDCLAAFLASDAASAMSLCPVTHHPGKCVSLRDQLVEPYTNDAEMEARHQDLPEVFRQNGAIYAVRVEPFLRTGRFFIRPCLGYRMASDESVDVDDELDLAIANALAARA